MFESFQSVDFLATTINSLAILCFSFRRVSIASRVVTINAEDCFTACIPSVCTLARSKPQSIHEFCRRSTVFDTK